MANLFKSVFIASLWGGGFTVILLLANRVFKKTVPLSWHYYIWLAVIVRLLVPAFIIVDVKTVPIPFISQEQVTAHKGHTIINTAPSNPLENMLISEEPISQPPDEVFDIPAITTVLSSSSKLIYVDYLWIVWLVIAVIILLHNSLSYFLYIRKLMTHNIQPNNEDQQIFATFTEKMSISGNVSFFRNKIAQTPFVIGIINPTIILPDKKYTAAQLSLIFSHELNHIIHYDIVIKWLFEIAKAIHWFNPFVYVATKNASFFCEAFCDITVLKNSNAEERREYSLTIIDIISQTVNPQTSVCVSMSSKKASLKERLRYIMNNSHDKKSITLTAIMTVFVLTLCACSGLQYRETPQLMQTFEPIISSAAKKDDIYDTAISAQTIEKENVLPANDKTIKNILIAGLDNNSASPNADVIIIAGLNCETGEINLLSVPRDTYLSPSANTVSNLKQQGVDIPAAIKFGQLSAYANDNKMMEYLQAEINNTLGVQIDYYIKMDMASFEKIVDAVGGVDIEVSGDGLYYSDPAQELEIALKGGLQHLDGKQALQYVRYRVSYSRGDIDRISVQQQFIRELYTKLIDGNDLPDKVSAMLSILIKNTETNLTIGDLASFAQYIPKTKADSLHTYILPGETEIIDQRSYVVIKHEAIESFIVDKFK